MNGHIAGLAIDAATALWGETTSVDEVTEEVYWIKTIGHGGILVSTVKAETFLSDEARSLSQRSHAWLCYEEDCLCFLVIREHPELFPPEEHGGQKVIEQMCKVAKMVA